MKRGILILVFLASLFLVNFVSAQFFDSYGGGGFFDGFGGGRISLGDFFDSLDPSTVIYGLLFFILFTVLTLALSRVKLFRDAQGQPNTIASGVVSFAISAMIVYYLYRSGYNLESFFYDIGFSVDLFSFLLTVVFVLLAFVIIKRYRLGGFFIVSGLFVMFISIFTDLVYEKATAFLIGLILLVIGIFLRKNTRKWWKKNIRTP